MLKSLKRQKQWERWDRLMRRWDTIQEESDKLFEITHPWLFNLETKPEIIENDETQRIEDKLHDARVALYVEVTKLQEKMFPVRPVIITQIKML